MTVSTHSMDQGSIARQTARMLLEIEAVHFSDNQPFILSSGWASPVYIDCRKVISYPRLRTALMDFSATTIVREIGRDSIDVVAGGETAGIPFAAWIADRLSIPMQYIRKQARGIGQNAQIEGDVTANARTLLVEDLATDGRSKVNFCQALRDVGAKVDHCFVLFYYDIFPNSRELMRDLNVELHCLATWWDVLDVAKETQHFNNSVLAKMEEFLCNPAKWSAAHGGAAEIGSERVRGRQ